MDNLSYNMQALEIDLVSEVLLKTIETKTVEAKQQELALWKIFHYFLPLNYLPKSTYKHISTYIN